MPAAARVAVAAVEEEALVDQELGAAGIMAGWIPWMKKMKQMVKASCGFGSS